MMSALAGHAGRGGLGRVASPPSLSAAAALGCGGLACNGAGRGRRQRAASFSGSRGSGAVACSAASSKSVAVIGGGAAGLAAAKELLAEGHTVAVFESGGAIGGVWVYNDATEADDPLGMDPTRARVHGSMYRSLRTNLPCELMGFPSFPFQSSDFGDDRRFPGHAAVGRYLQAYADHHGLNRHVRLETQVVRAAPVGGHNIEGDGGEGGGDVAWEVTTKAGGGSDGGGAERTDVFDAVVVCNGHYAEPRLPDVAGAAGFPGQEMHSHNYRSPDSFAGKRVVLLGALASGEDIARDVASVADAVYLAARSWQNPAWGEDPNPFGDRGNIWRRRNIARLLPSGAVEFEGGMVEEGIDVVMYCTGYVYSFPFLEGTGVVDVEENRVAPLYQHVFPPRFAPSLSFIGLPFKVVPFPQQELQALWIARVLSNRAALPPPSEMEAAAAEEAARLEAAGVATRHHHQMGDKQWEYNDSLARMAGLGREGAGLPEWRRKMYEATGRAKRAYPEAYRDNWDDEEWRAVAAVDFEDVRAGWKAAAKI